MRHLAITGIVTASWMPRIMSGSDMRATPPSRRMSAGTRSRALPPRAPASAAVLACSASTTSMITPPFSISARPLLTRIVPISLMPRMLPGEERLDGGAVARRLLQMEHVPRVLDDHELRPRDAVDEHLRRCRSADEVVPPGDHERLRLDPPEVGPEVERRRVELAQRLGVHALHLDE